MKHKPKKQIRFVAFTPHIGVLNTLYKLLSPYELVLDERNPQLVIVEQSREHEARAQHWADKGVPTLYFSGECTMFRKHPFITFYLRLDHWLLGYFPMFLRRHLFYFLCVQHKSITKILFAYPEYIHRSISTFATSGRPWQYALLCNTLSTEKQNPRILSFPFFFLYETFLEEGYVKNPLALAEDDYCNRNFCVLVCTNMHKLDTFALYWTMNTYKRVAFYGRSRMASHGPLPGHGPQTVPLYRSYRFVISTENTSAEYYITEKICCALRAGAVPIYWGAPNVGDYFNLKRMVSYNEYGSYKAMRNKVKELEENPDAYAEVVAQPIFTEQNLENIHRTYDRLRDFLAEICEDALSTTPAQRLPLDPNK